MLLDTFLTNLLIVKKKKALANAGPRGDPIETPSICLHSWALNTTSIPT